MITFWSVQVVGLANKAGICTIGYGNSVNPALLQNTSDSLARMTFCDTVPVMAVCKKWTPRSLHAGSLLPVYTCRRCLSGRDRLFRVSEEVQDALATGKPVVALETTIYTHGKRSA